MRRLFFMLLAMYTLVSCEEEKYVSSSDAKLAFSTPIVKFDTVYSSIDNGTRHLKVYNLYDQIMKISVVRLASGSNSFFRLNINGDYSNEQLELEIAPRDSIYIFVGIAENIDSLNFVLKDSIEFLTNGNFQKVNLIAWKQNVNVIQDDIETSQVWTSEKPYLVSRRIEIASDATLTIKPGTKIYFQEGAGLFVWGKLIAKGSIQHPILFQAAKSSNSYTPVQWNGILLFSGSHNNELDFVEIKDANVALQVGNVENEGYASVVIGNSKFYSNSFAGIFAVKSKIRGYNVLITDYGLYGMALLVGGEYEFFHTTVADYCSDIFATPRNTPSLMISDHVVVERNGRNITYQGEMKKAFFANTIIGGDNVSGNELEIVKKEEDKMSFRFDHCFLQLTDTFNISSLTHYNKIIKGGTPGFIDPYRTLNFELDSFSVARDAGMKDISMKYPFDLKMQNRNIDKAPDLGAYEQFAKDN